MLKFLRDITSQSLFNPRDMKGAIRIYTFFAEYFVLKDITLLDVYLCLHNSDTYLIQYLLNQLFQNVYQAIIRKQAPKDLMKLIIRNNKAIQQCQVAQCWQTIYEDVLKMFKSNSNPEIIELLKEKFQDLNYQQKCLLITYFINNFAHEFDFVQQQVLDQKELLKEFPISQQKFENKKQLLQDKIQELDQEISDCQKQLRKYENSRQMTLHQKKQYKELLRDIENKEREQQKYKIFINSNYNLIQLFKYSQLNVLIRNQDYSLICYKHLPNYLVVVIDQDYFILYGNQALQFIEKFDLQIDLIYFNHEDLPLISQNEVIMQWKKHKELFILNKEGFKQFEKIYGNIKFLVYGEEVKLELLNELFIHIEQVVWKFFQDHYQLQYIKEEERNQWKNKILKAENQDVILYSINVFIPSITKQLSQLKYNPFYKKFKDYQFDYRFSPYIQLLTIYYIILQLVYNKSQIQEEKSKNETEQMQSESNAGKLRRRQRKTISSSDSEQDVKENDSQSDYDYSADFQKYNYKN